MLGILLVTVIAVVSIYNKLVTARNRMNEAWSGIDVLHNKRHDLVPNLVATVKGYATHERQTFEEVARYRSQAMNAKEQGTRMESESGLGQALGRLMSVTENYPQLKANVHFLELQKQLSAIEEELSLSRRYYNGTVRENNIRIESFPSNIIASVFGFEKGKFYEIDKNVRTVPHVSF
jgi:LemA protein